MKKILLFLFLCLSNLIFCEKDIREFHQPMEEKVFELESDQSKDEKIEEAFQLGKERIDKLKAREKELLDLETSAGIDRSKEIEYLEKKYNEILETYSKIRNEKELLLLENENYREQLKRYEDLEKSVPFC